MSFANPSSVELKTRHRIGRCFELLCQASAWFGIVVLLVLLIGVAWQAFGWLNWDFVTSFDSRKPAQAGIKAGLWGSFWLISLTASFAVPIGVSAAIYLEEYAPENWLTRFVQLNLANLAGIPSIVYGLLGMTVFVRMFGMFHADPKVIKIALGFAEMEIQLPFGRTVLSSALTLSLLILPVVIVAAQEALRAIPPSIRHASLAVGATQWQTIRYHVLPAAMPGILTGVILALSRAIGETAPLVIIGALTYVGFTPGDIGSVGDFFTNPQGVVEAPFDIFTALPILIFNWVSRPKAEYQHVAAAGILVLLAVLLIMNSAAILMRYRFQRRIRW